MNREISIQKRNDSIFVEKSEGTRVNYFIYPEFEVHLNTILPGTVQGWHAHELVEEVLVAVQGSFFVEYLIEQQIRSVLVETGDVVRVNNSIHRLLNTGEAAAEFTVFRFISKGEENREKIKQDKIEYSKAEIEQLLLP